MYDIRPTDACWLLFCSGHCCCGWEFWVLTLGQNSRLPTTTLLFFGGWVTRAWFQARCCFSRLLLDGLQPNRCPHMQTGGPLTANNCVESVNESRARAGWFARLEHPSTNCALSLSIFGRQQPQSRERLSPSSFDVAKVSRLDIYTRLDSQATYACHQRTFSGSSNDRCDDGTTGLPQLAPQTLRGCDAVHVQWHAAGAGEARGVTNEREVVRLGHSCYNVCSRLRNGEQGVR